MKDSELRFRQVHLDFHTSGDIPGIGSQFDPDEFADTLAQARVDSITCFARCHHGYLYYDSKKFPDRVHPHLKNRNLLAQQIEACHKRGIRVPIYITVQWDHLLAQEHPEWLMMTHEGKVFGIGPYEAGFYRFLCVNTPYADFLMEHTKEVLQTLPVDGLFFDIVSIKECSCSACRREMVQTGLEPSNADDRMRQAHRVISRFESKMTAMIRKYNKDCTIFYNSGHIGPRHRKAGKAFSHFELESLPSGGAGYMHFPLMAKYARTLNSQVLGQTGKFHTSWGDFHSFKNPAALEFECFNMLANAAKCQVGDQLHPSGKICKTTYDLIGSVYKQVEAKEPWCTGARAITEIGVMTHEESRLAHWAKELEAPMGAVRMLQEGHHQFDIIDSHADLRKYKLLILADQVPVSPELGRKLDQYVADGGSLIATYRSGLGADGKAFNLKCLGVSLVGEAPFNPDFIIPREPFANGLPQTEHVMYLRGLEVAASARAKVLLGTVLPYFNRTYKTFCSHKHAPSSRKKGYPAVVQKGRAIYFAHPIFMQYFDNAPLWCKAMMLGAIERLLEKPLVQTDAPSGAIVTLTQQAAPKRQIAHVLYYVPERRGLKFDIIEDVIPIHDVKVAVRSDRPIRNVQCVPQGEALEFTQKGQYVEFTVPRVCGHQMIELA